MEQSIFNLTAYFSQDVGDLFTWKDKKKTGIIFLTANMFFMLINCFGYSLFSLMLLFGFFVSFLGMALNVVYRASMNDSQPSGEQENQAQNNAIEDENVEYVSTETIQDFILWLYKASLRVQYHISDILSWKDAKITMRAILTVSGVFALSFILGDSVFLWLACDLWLLWPLIYSKKKSQIDKVLTQLNQKIDQFIYKVPFIKRIELKKQVNDQKKIQ